MKSFQTEIKLHGLRPDGFTVKNSGFCINCRGVRTQKEGLEGYITDFSTLPQIVYGAGFLDMAIDWPFPQIWQTDTGIWIGKRDGLYLAVGITGTWTATKIAAAVTDWPWTLANCPMFPVFASGDFLVYYDYDVDEWIVYDSTNDGGSHWDDTWKAPVSVLFHLGQIIAIGANIASTAPSDSRIVRWSEIGAFRFLGKTATPHRNEAGFTYAGIDDNEILLRALPLKKKIMVYGTFSCFSMKPVVSPAPTFALDSVKAIGIVNPLAVGGNEDKHLLVARDGTLWLISPDTYGNTKMEAVGFSEYLANMQATIDRAVGTGIVSVVYNEVEDEFYISDGSEAFLFNEHGLVRMEKNLTGFINFENAALTNTSQFTYIGDHPYGIFSTNADETFTFQSDIIDLGMNAIKTIEAVEIIGTLPSDAVTEVMIETRVDRTQTFRTTNWVRCNPSGVASPIVAGVELRVNIRCTKVTDLILEKLRLWWKLNDKRNIRGNYVTSASS